MTMVGLVTSAALFVVSLAVLLKASNLFVSRAERLGLSIGVSPFIIGATIVASGTSLPELVSSVIAVLEDAPEIVLGTVIGSNIANIFLILGIVALAGGRLRINRELMRVDLPLLIASAGFLVIAVWTGPFVWYEGLVALGGLAVYIHFTFSEEDRLDEVVEGLVIEHLEPEGVPADLGKIEKTAVGPEIGLWTYAVILGSLLLIFLAADLLVEAILGLAGALEVGADVIAITAMAVGSSVPEVAVSVVAVRRGDIEIAVGNILGSNIFNTFAVMGIPSFFGALVVPENVRLYALPVMVLATLLYYFITQDREITRWEGVMLLLLYAVFLMNLPGLT